MLFTLTATKWLVAFNSTRGIGTIEVTADKPLGCPLHPGALKVLRDGSKALVEREMQKQDGPDAPPVSLDIYYILAATPLQAEEPAILPVSGLVT